MAYLTGQSGVSRWTDAGLDQSGPAPLRLLRLNRCFHGDVRNPYRTIHDDITATADDDTAKSDDVTGMTNDVCVYLLCCSLVPYEALMMTYWTLLRTDMKSARLTGFSDTELKYFHLCCDTNTHNNTQTHTQ